MAARALGRAAPDVPGRRRRGGKGAVLAAVSDPFGEEEQEITAPFDGIIVGRAVMPVVNEGDAVFHLGRVASLSRAETTMDDVTTQMADDPLFDEDEII